MGGGAGWEFVNLRGRGAQLLRAQGRSPQADSRANRRAVAASCARYDDYLVMPLISSAIFSVMSLCGMAVCIDMIFIMSPSTLILPVMNACIAAA